MMNEELIEYYVNLLIAQYRDKPNAQATIRLFVGIIMIFDLIDQVQNGYNIDPDLGDTAVGVQLDVVAKYVGAKRKVSGIDYEQDYFGLALYSASSPFEYSGFAKYDDDDPDGQFMRYADDFNYIFSLTDSELLKVVQMKILQNKTGTSVYDIDNLIYTYFGDDGRMVDNEDMSLAYTFSESQRKLVTIADAFGLIPKPMGVSKTILFE